MALGEQAPKSLAIRYAKTVALVTGPPMVLFYHVFWPIIRLLNAASNATLWLLGLRAATSEEVSHTEEELRHIVAESAGGGHLTRAERMMIENVLNLEDKTARRVMVPRPDIIYLSLARSIEENLRIARSAGHTRFPLCEDDLTRIVGMIHVKDLFRTAAAPRVDLRRLSRPVPFLPETIHLDHLLLEFQRKRTHLAMLVDEYGAVVGMITLENVLEQVVGPIEDEFDREIPRVIDLGSGIFDVDAACPLDELSEVCQIQLPETDASTAGGLILERLGRLAQAGDAIDVDGHRFTVTQADPTRIRRVRVESVPQISTIGS
jgi:CBS domain containing-hemolysin-like protein